jgi:hypothetical protein
VTDDVTREHAERFAFDHLHTRATALAGDASKAADGSATRPSRRHHGVPATRLVALAATVSALLFGGPAALRADPAEAASPKENAVSAFGGAPDLGPEPGLDLNAGVIDVAAHPSRDGYWLLGADGGVFTFGNAHFHGSAGAMTLNAPIVGMAAHPGGEGYWLVATDGGVFSFGDARFHGSTGGIPLASPILSIIATPSGEGYWLVAADGGVFSFGDARFFGSAAGIDKHGPVIAAAPTRSGKGYWLLSVDGGVFAFGDAAFRGSRIDHGTPAVGIAAAPDGSGYWVVRANGALHAFGAPHLGDVVGLDPAAAQHPTVGIAARARGGYWIAQGETPPPPAAPAPDLSQHPFLVCTRRIESGGNYAAVNPSGTYRGAYQFSRSTWDNTARHAGRFDLVGVDPAAAAPHDQDFMALHLFGWQGARPWGGRCA